MKKAQGFFDIYVIFVFLFVITLVIGICLFVLGQFTDSWNEQQAVPEDVKTQVGFYNEQMNAVMDGGIILWFVILVLGSWATAFFLDNSPVFFVIFLLLSIISFFSLPILSNLQSDLSESALSSGFNSIPMAMYISNNIVMFMILYVVGIGICLYAKTRVSQ